MKIILMTAAYFILMPAFADEGADCGVAQAELVLEARAAELVIQRAGWWNRLLITFGLAEKPHAPVAELHTPQAYGALGFGQGGMPIYKARGDYGDVGEAVWVAQQALRDSVAFEGVRRSLAGGVTLDKLWYDQSFDASFLGFENSVQLLVVSREMYRRLGKEQFKKFVDFLRADRQKGDAVWQLVFNSKEPGDAGSNPRNVRKLLRSPASRDEALEDFVALAESKGVGVEDAARILDDARRKECDPR